MLVGTSEGHLFQGRTTPFPKCFLLRSKREGSALLKTNAGFYSSHMLSCLFSPVLRDRQGKEVIFVTLRLGH